MTTKRSGDQETLIAQRLASARARAGLTQREAAKALDMRHSTISQYENAKRLPDAVTLTRLADLYDTSIRYLYGETDNPNRDVEGAIVYSADFPIPSRRMAELDEEGRAEAEKELRDFETWLIAKYKRKREDRSGGRGREDAP